MIREMGTPEGADEFHRRLVQGDIPEHLKAFGISYIMQVVYFKELAERFTVVHVTEGLAADQVEMMGFTYQRDLQGAIDLLSERFPEAKVAVFPSGGNIIPAVR